MFDTTRSLHANQMFSTRPTAGQATVLWHAASGQELTLSSRAFQLLTMFTFPRNVDDVIAEIAGVDDVAREALTTVIGTLVESNALVESVPEVDLPRDVGARGAFGAASMPIDAAIANPRIDGVIVGVEYDAGASAKSGSRLAPDSIRNASTSIFSASAGSGMYDPTTQSRLLDGVRLADIGNLGSQVQTRNGHVLDELASVAQAAAEADKLLIALGGDHSITHAIIRGYIDAGIARIGLLHFDAHSDYFEPLTGDWRSSLHHGNVMSWIAGEEAVLQIAQFGVRQLTSESQSSDNKIRVWPGRSALGVNPSTLTENLTRDLAWHITIDVDVLDPAVLPSTGTPLPGGLFAHELNELIHNATRGQKVLGIDMVELIGGGSEPSALIASDVLLRAVQSATAI
ncbi:arginase family protein [Plantibacter sp. YIM 135347]|uniref:arginase family protein n=1 Tax=Plantibacter sp. YIM 135347 TaxID=3423919 RepID=UPI003D329F2A